jgi:hypothetical protein
VKRPRVTDEYLHVAKFLHILESVFNRKAEFEEMAHKDVSVAEIGFYVLILCVVNQCTTLS